MTLRRLVFPACCLVLAAGACFGPFSYITSDAKLQDQSKFNPGGTGFAVLDEHIFADAGYGAVELRQRPEARVIVFLSGTRFDPEADLAAMPARQREDLVADVGRSDLFMIENLPASAVQPNNSLNASIPSGPTDQFTFVLQRATVGFQRNLTYAQMPVFGSRQTVFAQPTSVDLREEFGRLDFNPITITLERGASQPDSAPVSTGTITIHANIPILSERLGKANLAVLRGALKTP